MNTAKALMNEADCTVNLLESLVVMTVHISNHEVENWHVHQVQKATTRIVRGNIPNLIEENY